MSEFHRDHPERAFTNDDPWMQHRSFRVAAGLEGREPAEERLPSARRCPGGTLGTGSPPACQDVEAATPTPEGDDA